MATMATSYITIQQPVLPAGDAKKNYAQLQSPVSVDQGLGMKMSIHFV